MIRLLPLSLPNPTPPKTHRLGRLLPLALGLAVLLPVVAAGDQIAEVENLGSALVFHPLNEFGELVLTVTGPCDFQYRQRVTRGEPVFKLGPTTIDGVYRFDLVRVETIDPAIIKALREARAKNDDEFSRQLCRDGRLPGPPASQSSGFQVLRGEIIYDPGSIEKVGRKDGADGGPVAGASLGASLTSSAPGVPFKDFVINDDLIVDGSACIGFDCVNGESFGFDTLRLKENNLRIKFDDTSTAASFPRNDWQLTANDSANGGASKFSIDDISNSRTPFTVEANARSHSLYVDDGGRIGSRTSTPSVELHTIDGDTPTLRLQQDGSSGFAPQTWDVAGNETNFFVRDVTNGSALPFRIRPGAPSSSIFIDLDGDVGMGTSSPSARLHVLQTANAATGDVHLLVENSNATTLARTMMKLSNNGNTFFDMENRNAHTWRINSNNSQYLVLDDQNDAGTEFELRPNGELRLEGALVTTSTREAKQDIAPADAQAILDRLTALPISTWSYKQDPGTVHLGPMAEDFYDAFGLGSTNKGISVLDASTVALAAIQALRHELDAKQQEVDALAAANAGLAARLEAVEKIISQTQ